jgi:hypothetical protein
MTHRLRSLSELAPLPGGLPDHVINAVMELSPTLGSALYAAYAGIRLMSLLLLAGWR